MLSVRASVTLNDIKDVKKDIQSKLDTLSNNLNIKISNVKIEGVESSRKTIQNDIDQITNKIQVKIDSIKISQKGLNELKNQLKEQKLGIEVEQKTNGKISTDTKEINETTQATRQLNNEIAKTNISKYEQLEDILRRIELEYGKVAKVSTTINSKGFETGKVITYKNALGDVVQEFYGLQKMEDGTYNIANGLELMNTKITHSVEQLSKVQDKTSSLKKEAETLINSFSGNGLLNNSFVQTLQNQLDGINIDKGSKEIEEFVGQLKKLKTSENQIISLTQHLEKLENSVNEIKGTKSLNLMDNSQLVVLGQAESAIKNVKNTIVDLQNGTTKTSTEIRNLISNSKSAGATMVQEFSEATTTVSGLGSAFKNLANYLIGGSGILLAIQTVKNAFDDLREIDGALIDISRVADFDDQGLKAYTQQANTLGRELNQTTQDILDTSYAVAKLGYNLEEQGHELVKWTSIFANVGDIDINTAMGDLVTILKGFNMEASESERIINAFNNVSNNMAISAGDIGEAFKSSASNLHLANTSLEEGIGLISGATEVLQDASRSGNGIKTISLRVQSFSDKLKQMGIDVYNSRGELNSLYDIMIQASEVYNSLSDDKAKYSLLETLGGKQQASVVSALISNIDGVKKAYDLATNSANSASKEQERLMNSLDAIINSLKQNLVGLWQDLGDSEAIKNLVRSLDEMITSLRENDELISTLGNGISGTLNILTNFVDKFGMLGTTFLGFTGYLSLTNEKFKAFGKGLSNSIPIINKIPKAFTKAQQSLATYSKTASDNVKSQQALVNSMKMGTSSYAGASAKLLAYKGSLVASKVATTTLTVATELFNSALTMGISFLITKGISALSSWANKSKEVAEANREYADSMSNMGDGFSFGDSKSINELLNNYKSMRKEMSLMVEGSDAYKEKEEQLKAIEEQMLEILPQLNQCYVDGSEAKGLEIEATEKLIGKELELAKAKANQVLEDNDVGGLEDLKEQIQYLKATEGQIKTVNKLKEEGKKTGITLVDKDWNGTGELSTVVSDLDDYIERQEELSSSLEATYRAYEVLDGGTGKYKEELALIGDALGIVKENAQEFTETSNNADSSNLVNELELIETGAEEVTNALNDMYDMFDGLTGDIELLEEAIAQLQAYGKVEEDTYNSILSSGNSALIDILYDQNTALDKAIGLQKDYEQQQANTAKNMIEYAHAQQEANRQLAQSEQDKINTIVNGEQAIANAKGKFVDQDVALAQQELQNFIDMTNAKIGVNDDLCSLLYQGIVDYVNNGGQLYAIDSQNFANTLNNKGDNNTNWVNTVMRQVAETVLAESKNYSEDTVNWAKALTAKDGANAEAFSHITQNVAQALVNMGQNYQSDYDSFYRFTSAKASLYNNFAGQIRSNISSMSDMFSGLNESAKESTDTILTGTKAELDALMAKNRQLNEITLQGSSPSVGSYSGTSLSGGNYVGSYGGGSGAGGSSGSGSSGSGSGSSSSGSTSTEREVEDMEDLVDIYAEVEKQIKKCENQLDIYKTLQESSNNAEAVKYIELQVGAYKKLREEQQRLLNIQKNRKAELERELRQNGFDIDSSNGAVNNYESQLRALTNLQQGLSGEAKQSHIEYIKAVNELVQEYNDLVGALGSTEGELVDINLQIQELYKSKVDMVGDAESEIYSIIEHSAQKQIDIQKKALEEVQEARNKMREEEEYSKGKEKRISELADIESQMEILSRDNSLTGQRKLQELQEQYNTLLEEINGTVQNRQDDLFDTMIDQEVESLDKQLEEYLDPENINKVIAEAMNSGMVDVLGSMYDLKELSAGYYSDTEVGLTNTIALTNEWVESLEKAQSAFVAISDSYANLGYNTNLYQQGIDFNNTTGAGSNVTMNYTLQFPENVGTMDRQTIERIIQPMLAYSEKSTIEAITNALTK
jgi:TP901 family phage tail tape measure protein